MLKALPVPAATSPASQPFRELGGKRLELLKEAVLKISRVAVLYDPANPQNLHEVKELLPADARALKLTIEPWEIRAADDFEKVFAALNKQRPDGLYAITPGGLMRPNQKRIVGFALKSRLPSMFTSGEAVEAGGLMSYRADLADSYRRVAIYVDKILKGANPADLPVEQPSKFELIRESQDCQADRCDHSVERAGESG
jgi:putative ABC transport system substrate-binding protein